MDISLSPDNERFLQSQIAAGIYKTISEAVNAYISITAFYKAGCDEKRLEQLNAEIQRGIDDYHAGRFQDGAAVFKELTAEYD